MVALFPMLSNLSGNLVLRAPLSLVLIPFAETSTLLVVPNAWRAP